MYRQWNSKLKCPKSTEQGRFHLNIKAFLRHIFALSILTSQFNI
jgi:hypothetical protein